MTSEVNFNNASSDYCFAEADDYLQWDTLYAGQNSTQLCPKRKGFDPLKLVVRLCFYSSNNCSKCSEEAPSIESYTNYEACYRDNLRPFLKLMQLQGITEIVNATRIMELVGLSISLVSLILSLIIFHKYRILRNNRTKIHKNLFTAILLQVIFRLLQYVDQWAPFVDHNTTEYICIAEVILLEFAKFAMIIWMLIEGLYLHNAITLTVFQEHSRIRYYFYLGWAAPFLFTITWAISMTFINTDVCWFLYQFEKNYWILEGPSSGILIINILFLLNIIRILIGKLRVTSTGEMAQLWKAVKAATFLVPLMGINNVLFTISFSVFNQLSTFAIWAIISYFLFSFQGCIISVLYCFLNGEVRAAVKNSISIYYCQLYLKGDNRAVDRNSGGRRGRKYSLGDIGLTTMETVGMRDI